MKKLFMVIFLMMVTIIWAERSVFRPDMLMNQFNGFNNLQMNHSISFSSGVSSNSQSYYISTYTNHLKYQFGPKLDLKLDLNFVNFGTATYKSGIEFNGNKDNSNIVIPEFELNYQPSENTSIKFKFRTVTPFYNRSDDFLKW
ncbi:MAG: hypothetical protein KAS49_04195 [Candidatus Cloacimonetes bacterium]|nr:hypothetical protein [Candidatus Cloacimonadota bacterium]